MMDDGYVRGEWDIPEVFDENTGITEAMKGKPPEKCLKIRQEAFYPGEIIHNIVSGKISVVGLDGEIMQLKRLPDLKGFTDDEMLNELIRRNEENDG